MLPVLKNGNQELVIGQCDNNNKILIFNKEDTINFDTHNLFASHSIDSNGNIKITSISVFPKNEKKEKKETVMEPKVKKESSETKAIKIV